ncbi:helix-turn-helix transcriptional regulator [Halomonas salifodinae]|uniref:helix-turn-helix transcriptional regulator n=1 Tax=Halomonas salifodinae TaxID=438745 RepID=UPI0033A11EE1
MTQVSLARRERGQERLQLPEEVGECYSERLALESDLILIRLRYRPCCDLREESVDPHGRPMLAITLGFEGRSGYQGGDGAELAFRAGFTTIAAFRSNRGERHYRAGETVSQLRLLVGEVTLTKYVGRERAKALLGNGGVRQLAFRKNTSLSQGHAAALSGHLGQPDPGLLDMHIHALSLLAEQLRLIGPSTPPPSRLGCRDIEMLERARDLMAERMNQPLTIPFLCAEVGLNEFKLKEGFRRHFNTTPHRMLHEMRMRKAHALLESGCQVAQVAYRVGYRHPSNFSTAFSRFFGRAPKAVFAGRRG